MAAWYHTSERMRVLSTRILPLRVRFLSMSDAALFLAFWKRVSQRAAEFSGVMGR